MKDMTQSYVVGAYENPSFDTAIILNADGDISGLDEEDPQKFPSQS